MSENSFLEVEFVNPSGEEVEIPWYTRVVLGFLFGVLFLFVLSISAFLVLIFVFGFHGTQGIPIISEVDLPNSRYSVTLNGPVSEDHHYFYNIFAEKPFKRYGSYSLGLSHVDEAAEPVVQELAPEVFRIDWGTGPNAAYTILDLKHGRMVEDSNPENKRNKLFRSEPEYNLDCD